MKARRFITAVLATGMMLAGPSAAFATGGGGGPTCTTTCKSLITVGDIEINVTGNRVLTGSEVNIIKNSFNHNDVDVVILGKVTTAVLSFNNFYEKTICVQKGLVNVQVCNVL